MKVLLADQSVIDSTTVAEALRRAGHTVTLARHGAMALDLANTEPFDCIVAAWLLPRVDGIELTKRLRESPARETPIVMLSEFDEDIALRHAFESGVDECMPKPVEATDVVACVERCRARATSIVAPMPATDEGSSTDRPRHAHPKWTAVCIAASTGGPDALQTVVDGLPAIDDSVVFIIQHGPAWMFDLLQTRLQRYTDMQVVLATENAEIEPNKVYIANGEHMLVNPSGTRITLDGSPSPHHTKPAADPTFCSVARAFGSRSIAVTLTGLGSDASLGCEQIARAGGDVIVQDPATCAAPPMPRNVIERKVPCSVLELPAISIAISRAVGARSARAGV